MQKSLFCIVILLLPIWHLNAQESITMARSYRALAMGNTGVATASDSAALFYNPAILANVTSWWVDYITQTVVTSEGYESSQKIPILDSEGLVKDDMSSFLEQDNPYMKIDTGANFAMNLSQTGWTFAGAYLKEVIMTNVDTNGDTVSDTIFQRADTIIKGGLSFPLGWGRAAFPMGWGRMALGFAGTSVSRKESRSDATADGLPKFDTEESSVGYDFGFIFRFSNPAQITLGVVVQNIGGIQFGNKVEYEEPQLLNVGLGMGHKFPLWRFTMAVDVRDIKTEEPEKTDTKKKVIQTNRKRKNTIHVGAEIGFFPNSSGGSLVNARVGYNGGYPTYGVEINFFDHTLVAGYTVYGEEVGTEDEKIQNDRNVIYVSMGF